MANKGLSGLKDANLRFLSGWSNAVGLAKAIQGYFGDVRGKIRLCGQATVLSGQTTVTVVDANILATDLVFVTLATKGANTCVVNTVVITAATNFVITVSTDPGAGGCVFNYQVVRLLSAV